MPGNGHVPFLEGGMVATPSCYSTTISSLILYPSLRVADMRQVEVESVRSIPPGVIVPLSMKTLNLEVKSDLCALEAAKGKSLTKFAPQLTIDAL